MEKKSGKKSHLRSGNSVTYDSSYPIYAMAFSSFTSSLPNRHPRIAIGSFIEEINNCVDILSFDAYNLTLKPIPNLCFEHPYPPTKLMFHPNPFDSLKSNDILASCSDYLRLWEVGDTSIKDLVTFNKNKNSEYVAPLTSFDWNDVEPRRIGTSSIDTTCIIWDVEIGAFVTQIIAHDKEVYDIAWAEAAVFASVSADGSVRIFDLRMKDYTTIIYESPEPGTQLLKLAWNKHNLRYLAVMSDSNKIMILDMSSPGRPLVELARHQASFNAIAWSPQSQRHICSAGDDGQALIWELPTVERPNGIDPMAMYSAGAEINQIQWSAAHHDWIAIAFSNKLQLLNV
ncbi:hypothetical protein EJD97_018622 [Solanum chilense]|uniref:Uncharacterized protein n=1 Tax=Solanum chilense TaxID=4083 RepID=A0A6N2B0I2_SOLCI|nr:hypothetical protein EJD97_018622 [Solanum chilense]